MIDDDSPESTNPAVARAMGISIETETLGLMDSPERQNEYMLVCAAMDCAMRSRGDWFNTTATWFKSEYFTDAHLRSLYMAINELFNSGAPLTSKLIADKLPVDGTYFGTRAAEMYGIVKDSCAQGGNILYYAKRVYDAYKRIKVNEELLKAAGEVSEAPEPDAVITRIPEISSKYAPAPEMDHQADNEIMQDLVNQLDGKFNSDVITYGINTIDHHMVISPCQLITFTAATSGGKSVILTNIALNCARAHNKAVLFVTYEMSRAEVYSRMASIACKYPQNPIPNCKPPSDWDAGRFMNGLSIVDNLRRGGLIHVIDGGSKTIEQIEQYAKTTCANIDVGVIIIDYCQLVYPTDTKPMREQQVAHIINGMKRMASTCGVAVVTASQVNEDGATRESRAILQSSNVLIHMESNGERNDSICTVDFVVRKNRDGACINTKVFWDKPTFTMRDIDEYDDNELQTRKHKTYRDYNTPKAQEFTGDQLP